MAGLNIPNSISLIRIVLIVPFVACVISMSGGSNLARRSALGLLAFMGLSDAADGYLARRLGQQTRLGSVLDPLGDKLLVAISMVLLALPGTSVSGYRLPAWVVMASIGKDVLLVVGFLILWRVTGVVTIRPAISGKACTVLQFMLIAYVLAGPDLPAPLSGQTVFLAYFVASAALVALGHYVMLGWLAASCATRKQELPK